MKYMNSSDLLKGTPQTKTLEFSCYMSWYKPKNITNRYRIQIVMIPVIESIRFEKYNCVLMSKVVLKSPFLTFIS